MRLRKFNLLPFKRYEFAMRGNYIKVIATNADLKIETLGDESYLVLKLGEAVYLNQFDTVAVTSLSSQSNEIELLIGLNERVEANVNKIDATIVNNVSVSSGGNVYNFVNKRSNILGANGSEMIIDPFDNVSGAIVLSMGFVTKAATDYNRGGFYSGFNNPANIADGECLLSGFDLNLIAGAYFTAGKTDNAYMIESGRGLWFFNEIAETQSLRHVVYRLL